MVLQCNDQNQQAHGDGCARSLSQKQWWQVHGPSVQEAMIIKDACNMLSSVLGEELPEDSQFSVQYAGSEEATVGRCICSSLIRY